MNKNEYKELLLLRKSEELFIYYLMSEKKMKPYQVQELLPIPPRRFYYIIDKWERQGVAERAISIRHSELTGKEIVFSKI